MKPSALNDPRGPMYPDRVGHDLESGSPEWMAWVHEVDARRGYKVCGRKNRFSEPCEAASPKKATAMGDPRFGRPPCKRNHSGGSRVGIANQNYKHGMTTTRYRMVGRLQGYADRLDDIDYLSCREEIALTEELLSQAAEVLDDDTPCPEPPPSPLDPVTWGEAAALEREQEIGDRRAKIAQWHRDRAQATERYDSLTDTLRKLKATEIQRVKLAADTLTGQGVRVFSQTMLEVARRRMLAFGAANGVPIELVLNELADFQEEVVSVVRNSGGASPS